ncbi:rhodanese-like domain-containing protein [Candidatus Saccharibacteria bacterium]|nr:rhodanese-like domain-containing protein [Candidatus Saccharibacteria bacterium]NCS83082.1 rhodanese-like domain-containing protein [Candidatus Saccharibacteria bacterium]
MSNKRIIIDVREPYEYAMGHVDGALNITASELMSGSKKLEAVDKDAEIIVYCKTGGRASMSVQILNQLGFRNVVNGINAAQVEQKYFG